jgi:hypothetical protein
LFEVCFLKDIRYFQVVPQKHVRFVLRDAMHYNKVEPEKVNLMIVVAFHAKAPWDVATIEATIKDKKTMDKDYGSSGERHKISY